MGFLSLLVVASMPVLQLLLVGSLGAFLASGRSSLLSGNVRRDLNKIVFAVFSPSLIFSSLADTVTFQDLISWWFMPVNIGITFLIGGTLGWVAVNILRPDRHLEGLIMASCAAGNLGNLMLMIIPAVCGEHGSPFGDESSCSDRGQSYVSLSMAVTLKQITGFFVGAIPWLKSLIVGSSAPLRVIQDSLELLGNGTLPCTTLILGGNLIKGLKKSSVKPSTILAIALVRYVALPLSGIAVVKAAGALGFLPDDSLFRYVLLTQFTLPPAMAIGVMAQLFGVGQEESSVIFLWMYLTAALALTIWSTFFMYMIS
ncbi:hypothetical protein AXF42_Ash001750 [Apostasia shenzhenica]|uniref:Uncharacterized protein n=1 Tax=Apostasia shenzhenica TaxID=1088818 RepID=A0A2I0AB46_9ASPA|nr:hypothetical protein AXF42_Ash001750 [Apostasia shenzhenica]